MATWHSDLVCWCTNSGPSVPVEEKGGSARLQKDGKEENTDRGNSPDSEKQQGQGSANAVCGSVLSKAIAGCCA